MLIQSVTPKMWETVFISKFANFCKKSPVLLSMSIRIQNGEKGVIVTHVNSDTKYFFPFDYDIEPKDFIFKIKSFLIKKHYPRLVDEIYECVEKTPAELAEEVENSKNTDNLKTHALKLIGTKQYRIDKTLLHSNVAILVLEDSTIPGDKIGSSYSYQYNKSLMMFMKNYRKGKFKSIEEASNDFFNNANLIYEITEKGETNA